MTPDEMREFFDPGPITAQWMRVVEKNAESLGVIPLMMMESAGRALAAAVLESHPESVLVLCGRGNNGGDGMVAARYLQRELRTDVVYIDQMPRSHLNTLQLGILRSCAVGLHQVRCPSDVAALARLFKSTDVIVDALLGTGSEGEPKEPIPACITRANNAGVPIIAADIPTAGIRADRIIAFHRPKKAGAEVVDIGIPLEAECFTGPGELTLIPKKASDARKGAGGEVLVIGGGPYQGAPYLAGMAALRSGADIVRIASPIYLPQPDLIHERMTGLLIQEEDIPRLITLAKNADAVVCGNGLGIESHTVVREVAPYCRKLVVDADALRKPLPEGMETIYTPHAGEFLRVTGEKVPEDLGARGRLIRKAASGGIILLKGEVDVISDGTRLRFNRTGCPGMTVGGTGDVLAGLTAALFCRLPAFEAACVAAYANGWAGMQAEREQGDGMVASDLLTWLPSILFQEVEG